MKDTTTSVLGFDVPVTGQPTELQEAITAAGGEQQLMDGWLNYIRFHKTNTEARAEVSDRIANLTGIQRATKTVKAPTKSDPNNEREEWDETEAEHVKRAIAASGKTLAEIATDLLGGFTYTNEKNETVTVEPLSIAFSAQGQARTSTPKTIAKVYQKSAQTLIEKGEAVYNNAITLLQQANPGLEVARNDQGVPEVESLAAALKANRDRVEKESNAALGL